MKKKNIKRPEQKLSNISSSEVSENDIQQYVENLFKLHELQGALLAKLNHSLKSEKG